MTLWPHGLPHFPVHHQLPELTQTHVCHVSDAIQPSHPLSSPSPPTFNLSQHQGFSSELALHIRWPKYWSFSFSISPSNEYSGLISFGIDWLDLLAAQGTLKSLLQHHNLKASIIWCSAFFIVQLPPGNAGPAWRDPRIRVHWEAGSSSPSATAFDRSAQERCSLLPDTISPSWIYPQEKTVARDGSDIPCCGQLPKRKPDGIFRRGLL